MIKMVAYNFTPYNEDIQTLPQTASVMQLEWLEDCLQWFVEREEYEKAVIIKDEIKRREPKFKFYLTAPDGTMTELKGMNFTELPKFKP